MNTKTIKQRTISLLAVSAVMLSMSGCNGSNTDSSEEAKSSTTSSVSKTLANSVYEETIATTTTKVPDTLKELGIETIWEYDKDSDIARIAPEYITSHIQNALTENYSEINGRSLTYNEVIIYDCYFHETVDNPYGEAVAIADVYSEGGEYPDGEYYYAFNLTMKYVGDTSDYALNWLESVIAVDSFKFVEKSRAVITRDTETNSISLDVKNADE